MRKVLENFKLRFEAFDKIEIKEQSTKHPTNVPPNFQGHQKNKESWEPVRAERSPRRHDDYV